MFKNSFINLKTTTVKNTFVLFIIKLLLVSHLYGQQFLTPLNVFSADMEVEMTDGKNLKGDRMSVGWINWKKGYIKSFKFKEIETGVNERIYAEDIKYIRVKMGFHAKYVSLRDNTTSLQKIKISNFKELKEREWLEYHQITLPGKKPEVVLAQVLNPGWDSPIRVYDGVKKTREKRNKKGDVIGGGIPIRYLLDIDGDLVFVDKKQYQKTQFEELFGKCERLTELTKKEKRWDFLAEHVYIYNEECSGGK